MQERDHIGFDPSLWVERLLEVARHSQFNPRDKVLIERMLNALHQQLRSQPDK